MEPQDEHRVQSLISSDTPKQSTSDPNVENSKTAQSTSGTSIASIKDLTFKEASTELEGIVRALEAGDMELEQSLVAYKRGVELVKNLSMRLEKAEQEVSTLTAEIFPPETSE